MDSASLAKGLDHTVFAFRGYNVTNLGRTFEFLEHKAYGAEMERSLREASESASSILGRKIDLVARVRRQEETTLATYDEAIALVLGVERGQLNLLQEFHGVDCLSANCFCGYSLGEVGALIQAGSLTFDDALRVPLSLADDCVALADDVTLGVLFSRGAEIPAEDVDRLCLEINREGKGIVGVSAELSPNSFLLMGQGDTIARLKKLARERLETKTQIRRNSNQWPPLHTPIVWQRQISDRASELMHTLELGDRKPSVPIISMVTGGDDYTDTNIREMLRLWTYHRQELWRSVLQLLDRGIRTIVHVGPEPNIIPATFKRLRDNVEAQTQGSIGMKTLSRIVRRAWLKSILPKRTVLLNAMQIEQIQLEDWLLENEPS